MAKKKKNPQVSAAPKTEAVKEPEEKTEEPVVQEAESAETKELEALRAELVARLSMITIVNEQRKKSCRPMTTLFQRRSKPSFP